MKTAKAQESLNINAKWDAEETLIVDQDQAPPQKQEFQYFDEKQVQKSADDMFRSLDLRKDDDED